MVTPVGKQRDSVLEYTRRLGRSIAYGAFDAIKEQMPMTTSLIENNKETAKQLYRDVIGSKQQLTKLKTMQDTYLFKPAEQLLKNLKADLKSGVFYHPERAAQQEEESMKSMMESVLKDAGMEDLMDLLTGDGDMTESEMQDLPIQPVAEVSSGDALIATSIAKEQRGATQSLVKANTSLVEAQIRSTRTIANMQFKQMQRHTSIVTQGLENMTLGLNAIISFNNDVVLQHAKNAMQYFETMTTLTQENNAILKEMIEMKRNTYKKQSQDEALGGQADPFKNGVFDLKAYIDVFKSNMENSMFGQMGMMIAAVPAMIAGIVANPVHYGAKAIATAFLGPALRMAMKGFDRSINGYLQMGLTKMAEWGKRPGTGILGELAKLFGIETKQVNVRSINISKNIKEPRSWDGEDHFYLTKVIPSYLANIESALTGSEARHFDMQAGKWNTKSGIMRKARQQEQQLAESNLGEIRQAFMKDLLSTMNLGPNPDKQVLRQIQRGVDDLMLGIQKNGGIGMGVQDMSHYKDILANKNGEYGDNEQLRKIFYEWAKSADYDANKRQMFAAANGRVISSKRAEADRRIQGGDALTDVESMIATNADLNSTQIKLYNQLIEAIDKANSYDDQDKVRELQQQLANLGAQSTSVSSRADSSGLTSPLLRTETLGTSLIGWQEKIYDVLVDIRDGNRGGKGKRSKQKERASGISQGQTQGQSKEDNKITARVRGDGTIIWDEDYAALYYQELGQQIGTRASRSVGAAENVLNDKASMEQYLTHMKKKAADLRDQDTANRARYEHSILDGIVGADLSDKDIDDKLRSSYHVDPKASFLKQLAAAGSIGAKIGVISANISKITNAPRAVLTSVIMTADKMMYDFMFDKETGEQGPDGPVRGLFGKMSAKMSESAQRLSDKISSIADNLSKNSGKWIAKGKEFLKDWFGIDLGKVKEKAEDFTKPFKTGFQEAGKGVFNEISGAFKGTLADMGIGHREGPPIPGRAYGQYPAIVSKDEAIIRPDGSGTTRVKKSGVTAISDQDLILNARQNPWNPNRMSANLEADAENENRIRSTILSKMRSSGGSDYAAHLPGFAEGKSVNSLEYLLKKLDPEDYEMVMGPLMAMMNQAGIGPDQIKDMLADYVGKGAAKVSEKLGITDDEKNYIDQEILQRLWRSKAIRKDKLLQDFLAKTIKAAGYKGKLATEDEMVYEEYNQGSGILNGMGQFAMQAIGTDPSKAMEETKKYVIHNTPELMKGGMAGALIGSIFPLGGPLFGALAGSAVQVLANNKSFMNYIFGTEVVDQAGNKTRKNDGIVSTKFMKSLEKYLPDMKKYGITGSLVGLITPFGPLGGLMAGMAASYIKNNESARNFLFGDSGGLLNKDRKAAIKKALPSIGAAMLSTFFLGPFGLIGNAALGAGLGMLSTTEMFKKIMLGAKDRKGIRHGGLAGAIQRHITNPIKANMKAWKKDFAKWFRDDVTKPIGRGLKPIGDEIKIQLKRGMKGAMDTFLDAFVKASPMAEKFFDKLLGRGFLGGLIPGIREAGGIRKFLLQKSIGWGAKKIAGGIEAAGDKLRKGQLEKFQLNDISTTDTLAEMRRLNIENTNAGIGVKSIHDMGDAELAAATQNVQALSDLYSRNTKRAIEQRQAKQMNYMMSTISDVTKNNDYTSKYMKIHSDLMEIADQVQKLKDESGIKPLIEKADEIMEKAGMSSADKQRIREELTTAHVELGMVRKLREYQSEIGGAEAADEAIERIRQDVFKGTISREDLMKLLKTGRLAEYMEAQRGFRDKELAADEAKAEAHGDIVDRAAHTKQFTAAEAEKVQSLNANTDAIRRLTEVINGAPLRWDDKVFPDADMEGLLNEQRKAKVWADHSLRMSNKKDQAEFEGLRNKALALNADKTIEGLNSDEGMATFKEAIRGDSKGSRQVTRSLIELGRAYEMGNKAIIKNLEAILQIDSSGKLISRITSLTILGMEVDPDQYDIINDLNDEEFNCALELVKLSVKIDSFEIFRGLKDSNPLLPEMLVRLAATTVEKQDGKTSRIGDMLVADEMKYLLTDRTDAISKQYAATGSMSFVQRYFSPEDNGEHASWFESNMMDTEKNRIDKSGLTGSQLRNVQKGVLKADISDITGKHTGFAGALQSIGNAAQKGITGALNWQKDIAIGVTDRIFDNIKPGQSLVDTYRTLEASYQDPEFAKERSDVFVRHLVYKMGRFLTKGIQDQIYERSKKISEYFASDPVHHGPVLMELVQAVRSGRISGQDAVQLLDDAIEGKPVVIPPPEMEDDDEQSTNSGSSSTSPPASSSTQAAAAGAPGHAAGRVPSTGGTPAPGGNSGGLGGFLGGLFGGGSNDSKKEEASEEPEKATLADSKLKSSDIKDAIGSLADSMKAPPVMGGTMQSPLERGEKTVVPTQYGPMSYTTSSSDGSMMAEHTKDNAEVLAKEAKDIDRKERSVSALERIAEKLGALTQPAKAKVKKSGGGLLDMLKDLASLPFNMLGGLWNAFKSIPILGPLAAGLLAPVIAKFKGLATAFGAKVTDLKQKGLSKVGMAKGLIRSAIKTVLGSKWGKIALIIASFLGINLLSDSSAEAGTTNSGDRDENGNKRVGTQDAPNKDGVLSWVKDKASGALDAVKEHPLIAGIAGYLGLSAVHGRMQRNDQIRAQQEREARAQREATNVREQARQLTTQEQKKVDALKRNFDNARTPKDKMRAFEKLKSVVGEAEASKLTGANAAKLEEAARQTARTGAAKGIGTKFLDYVQRGLPSMGKFGKIAAGVAALGGAAYAGKKYLWDESNAAKYDVDDDARKLVYSIPGLYEEFGPLSPEELKGAYEMKKAKRDDEMIKGFIRNGRKIMGGQRLEHRTANDDKLDTMGNIAGKAGQFAMAFPFGMVETTGANILAGLMTKAPEAGARSGILGNFGLKHSLLAGTIRTGIDVAMGRQDPSQLLEWKDGDMLPSGLVPDLAKNTAMSMGANFVFNKLLQKTNTSGTFEAAKLENEIANLKKAPGFENKVAAKMAQGMTRDAAMKELARESLISQGIKAPRGYGIGKTLQKGVNWLGKLGTKGKIAAGLLTTLGIAKLGNASFEASHGNAAVAALGKPPIPDGFQLKKNDQGGFTLFDDKGQIVQVMDRQHAMMLARAQREYEAKVEAVKNGEVPKEAQVETGDTKEEEGILSKGTKQLGAIVGTGIGAQAGMALGHTKLGAVAGALGGAVGSNYLMDGELPSMGDAATKAAIAAGGMGAGWLALKHLVIPPTASASGQPASSIPPPTTTPTPAPQTTPPTSGQPRPTTPPTGQPTTPPASTTSHTTTPPPGNPPRPTTVARPGMIGKITEGLGKLGTKGKIVAGLIGALGVSNFLMGSHAEAATDLAHMSKGGMPMPGMVPGEDDEDYEDLDMMTPPEEGEGSSLGMMGSLIGMMGGGMLGKRLGGAKGAAIGSLLGSTVGSGGEAPGVLDLAFTGYNYYKDRKAEKATQMVAEGSQAAASNATRTATNVASTATAKTGLMSKLTKGLSKLGTKGKLAVAALGALGLSTLTSDDSKDTEYDDLMEMGEEGQGLDFRTYQTNEDALLKTKGGMPGAPGSIPGEDTEYGETSPEESGNATGGLLGMIAGGMLGRRFGGAKGAAIGSLLGSTVGSGGETPGLFDIGITGAQYLWDRRQERKAASTLAEGASEVAEQATKNATRTATNAAETAGIKAGKAATQEATTALQVAETQADKGKGIMTKVVEVVSKIKAGILKYMPSGAKGFVEKAAEAIIKKLAEPRQIATLAAKAAKSTVSSIPVIGWVIGAGFVAAGALSGLRNAEEILEIPEGTATPAMRGFAAFIGAITGAPILMFLPASLYVDLLLPLAKFLGFDTTDLEALRKAKLKQDQDLEASADIVTQDKVSQNAAKMAITNSTTGYQTKAITASAASSGNVGSKGSSGSNADAAQKTSEDEKEQAKKEEENKPGPDQTKSQKIKEFARRVKEQQDQHGGDTPREEKSTIRQYAEAAYDWMKEKWNSIFGDDDDNSGHKESGRKPSGKGTVGYFGRGRFGRFDWKDAFDAYDLNMVEDYNKPKFGDDEDSVDVFKAKLENLDRLGVPKKASTTESNYKSAFDEYDLSGVEDYNLPKFGPDGDSGTVLDAKLKNLERLGVPKKKKALGAGKFGRGRVGRGEPSFDPFHVKQTNPLWASWNFNKSGDTEVQTVGDSLCGPATYQMARNRLFGQTTSTSDMETMVKDSLPYKGIDDGVSEQFMVDEASKDGMRARKVTSRTEMAKAMDEGKYVSIMGNWNNTGMHWKGAFDPHKLGLGRGTVMQDDPESDGAEPVDSNELLAGAKSAVILEPDESGRGRRRGRGGWFGRAADTDKKDDKKEDKKDEKKDDNKTNESKSSNTTGKNLTMIGDSIMAGSTNSLKKVLPDANIDAKVGRFVHEGYDVAKSLKEQKKLTDDVVVELGTNGGLEGAYSTGFKNMLELLKDQKKVYWVTTFDDQNDEARKRTERTNEIIKALPSSYKNLKVLDWYSVASPHKDKWFSDHLHPSTQEGTDAFAKLIKDGVSDGRSNASDDKKSGDASNKPSNSGAKSSSGGFSGNILFDLLKASHTGMSNEVGGQLLRSFFTGIGSPSAGDGGGNGNSGGDGSDASTGSAAVSDNMSEEQIWDWFRSKGYKAEPTAGIMARLKQETGTYNPKYEKFERYNGDGEVGGFGMFQWTYGDGQGYNYPDPLGKDKETVYEKFPDSRLVKYMKWVDENKKGNYESSGNELEYLWQKDMDEHQHYATLSRHLSGYPRSSKSLKSWKPADFNALNASDAVLKWGMDYEIGIWGAEGESMAKELYEKYKDRTASSGSSDKDDKKDGKKDDKKDDTKKDDKEKGKGTFGRGTRLGRSLRRLLPKFGRSKEATSPDAEGAGPDDLSIKTRIKKLGRALTDKLVRAKHGLLTKVMPQTGRGLGRPSSFAKYGRGDYKAAASTMSQFAKEKFNKDVPEWFWRTILRSESTGNEGPMTSEVAKWAHNYGGMDYDPYMKEYGGKKADQAITGGHYVGVFPDEASGLKAEVAWFCRPGADKWWTSEIETAATGDWEKAIKMHVAHYVQGVEEVDDSTFKNSVYYSVGKEEFDGKKGSSGGSPSSSDDSKKDDSGGKSGGSGDTSGGGGFWGELYAAFKNGLNNTAGGRLIRAYLAGVGGGGGDNGGDSGDKGGSGDSSNTGGDSGSVSGGGDGLSNVKETNLDFSGGLTNRSATNRIVIHHTGDQDMDADAATIHGWHKGNGWSGIGYHFVIRKDGTIERGRPIDAVGSHAQGSNSDSLGIHVCGGFNSAQPTDKQLASLAQLIADLCKKYNISLDRKHILGHYEVCDTTCPGTNLKDKIETVISKAKSLGGGSSSNDDKNDDKKDDGKKGKGTRGRSKHQSFGRSMPKPRSPYASMSPDSEGAGPDRGSKEDRGVAGRGTSYNQMGAYKKFGRGFGRAFFDAHTDAIADKAQGQQPQPLRAEFTDPGTKGIRGYVKRDLVPKPSLTDAKGMATIANEAKNAYLEQLGKGRFGKGGSTPNDNAAMWQYLKKKGLSNVSAAGVMGNFQAESSMYSDMVEGGTHSDTCPRDSNTSEHADVPGYGLPQFTWSTLKDGLIEYAKSKGKPHSDWQMQIDYLFAGGKSGFTPDILKKMDETKDPYKAALVWHSDYERSADSESMAARRGEYAKKFFETEGKGQVDGDSNLSGESSNDDSKNDSGDSGGGKGFWSQLFAAFNKALKNSPAGKLILDFFGDDFSFGGDGGGGGGNGKSDDGGGGSTDAGIKKASEWAKSMVGQTGYGGNGCTTFVRNYLLKADNQVGKLMQDASSIASELETANAKLPPEDKGGSLMWVPLLEQWAKDKGLFKELSEGGKEGDICVCVNHGHVIIADGNGGYWGNSSSKNQIVHGDSITEHYSSVQGYIKTGSGKSTVSKGESKRSKEEQIADAGSTNAGQGTKGRGTQLRRAISPPVMLKGEKPEDPEANNSGGIRGNVAKLNYLASKQRQEEDKKGKGSTSIWKEDLDISRNMDMPEIPFQLKSGGDKNFNITPEESKTAGLGKGRGHRRRSHYGTGRFGKARDIGLPPTVHRVEQTPPTATSSLPTIMAKADNRIDNLSKEELPIASRRIDWKLIPKHGHIKPDDSDMTQRAKIKAAMKTDKGSHGRGRYGRFAPLAVAGQSLRAFIGNKLRTEFVQFVAKRYGAIKAAEVNAWIQTNAPRIASAIEAAGAVGDIAEAWDIVARMISGELDIPGLAMEVAQHLGGKLGGKLAQTLGLGTKPKVETPLTDEEIDNLPDDEVIAEIKKYDLTDVPEYNHPRFGQEDMGVLRSKLKKIVKQGKLKDEYAKQEQPIAVASSISWVAPEEPKKKRKNFLEKGWEVFTETWKKAQRTIGQALGFNQPQPKAIIGTAAYQEAWKPPKKRKYTDTRASNGFYIEQNDVDYLVSKGMSQQQAIETLLKDKKYTDSADPAKVAQIRQEKMREDQVFKTKASQSGLTGKKAPNGLEYEQNDIDFLMNQPWVTSEDQAYAILSKEKKYTEKVDEKAIAAQQQKYAKTLPMRIPTRVTSTFPIQQRRTIPTRTEPASRSPLTLRTPTTFPQLPTRHTWTVHPDQEAYQGMTPQSPALQAGKKLTNKKAPNGLYYEQNDVDYLVSTGLTEEKAYEVLSKEEKYTKEIPAEVVEAQDRMQADMERARKYAMVPQTSSWQRARIRYNPNAKDGRQRTLGSNVPMGAYRSSWQIPRPTIEASDAKPTQAQWGYTSTFPISPIPTFPTQPTISRAETKTGQPWPWRHTTTFPTNQTPIMPGSSGIPKQVEKPLMDEDIEKMGFDELQAEFNKYDLTTVPEENRPRFGEDDVGVLREKLKVVIKQAKRKPSATAVSSGSVDADKQKKPKNLVDAFTGIWKRTQRTIGKALGLDRGSKSKPAATVGIGGGIPYGTPPTFPTGYGYNKPRLADPQEGKELTDKKAPNGLYYEKNDVDYLVNQGYSIEKAYETLSKEEKYTKEVDPRIIERRDNARRTDLVQQYRRSGAVLTNKKAPNGLYYEKNDVDYLMQQPGMTEEKAYEILSKEDKYTKEADPELVAVQDQLQAEEAKRIKYAMMPQTSSWQRARIRYNPNAKDGRQRTLGSKAPMGEDVSSWQIPKPATDQDTKDKTRKPLGWGYTSTFPTNQAPTFPSSIPGTIPGQNGKDEKLNPWQWHTTTFPTNQVPTFPTQTTIPNQSGKDKLPPWQWHTTTFPTNQVPTFPTSTTQTMPKAEVEKPKQAEKPLTEEEIDKLGFDEIQAEFNKYDLSTVPEENHPSFTKDDLGVLRAKLKVVIKQAKRKPETKATGGTAVDQSQSKKPGTLGETLTGIWKKTQREIGKAFGLDSRFNSTKPTIGSGGVFGTPYPMGDGYWKPQLDDPQAGKELTDKKAPNGLYYEKNDLDYLTNQGIPEDKAYEILSKDKKYTEEIDPRILERRDNARRRELVQQYRKSGVALTNKKAPNGLYYEQNDLDYLMSQPGMTEEKAYEILSKEDKYTKEVDPELVEVQDQIQAEEVKRMKYAMMPQTSSWQRARIRFNPNSKDGRQRTLGDKVPMGGVRSSWQMPTPRDEEDKPIKPRATWGPQRGPSMMDIAAQQGGSAMGGIIKRDTDKLSNYKAPNGLFIEQNDIDYLTKNNKGMTELQLVKEDKYTKEVDSKVVQAQEQAKKQDWLRKQQETKDNVKSGVAPNGLPFDQNDVDYLMAQPWVKSKEQAYEILSREEKYNKPVDKKTIATSKKQQQDKAEKKEQKKKPRGFFGQLEDWGKRVLTTVGEALGITPKKPKEKEATDIPETQNESIELADKLSNYKAPNGLFIEQNDIDYLTKNNKGMTELQSSKRISTPKRSIPKLYKHKSKPRSKIG